MWHECQKREASVTHVIWHTRDSHDGASLVEFSSSGTAHWGSTMHSARAGWQEADLQEPLLLEAAVP